MLQGILSSKWRDEIAEYTKERVHCKASHLLKVIWKQFFIPIWNKRNKILHTEYSVAFTREHEIFDKTLDMFRLNYRELLHYSDYNLAEYTEDQTKHWGLDTKREIVKILIAARLIYASMIRKGDRRQLLITDYCK